jgi:hypothetical protein
MGNETRSPEPSTLKKESPNSSDEEGEIVNNEGDSLQTTTKKNLPSESS